MQSTVDQEAGFQQGSFNMGDFLFEGQQHQDFFHNDPALLASSGLPTVNPPMHNGYHNGLRTPLTSAEGNQQVPNMLEQQLKLNQLARLAELQNQIFQRQLELLGKDSRTGPRNVVHGMPTPLNSTEIPAQVNPSYPSPMMLHNYPEPQATPPSSFMSPPVRPSLTNSAPAHMAFNMNPPVPLASPSAMDFDLSPLTSPWLGAQGQQQNDEASSSKRSIPIGQASEEEYHHTRRKRASLRSVSTSSTPLLASAQDSTARNTPSPVDLSMLPVQAAADGQHIGALANGETVSGVKPVTPSQLMNIKVGLTAPSSQVAESSVIRTEKRRSSRGKPARLRSVGSGSSAKRSESPTAGPSASSLRTLLPDGVSLSSVPQLASTPNYAHHLSGASSSLNITPSTQLPNPPPQVKKTSHKAAEQKRRDSLKTSFDELRMLLPPIPLPTDENYGDEPVLPGAMPPRGPPKGDGDGPNRGASKLALLRCGNDYIRTLKLEMAAKDTEIENLRQELDRFRSLMGEVTDGDGEDNFQ